MSILDGIPVVRGVNPAHTEYMYRAKWLEKHKDASMIVVSETTGLPVRAEYDYEPVKMEPRL